VKPANQFEDIQALSYEQAFAELESIVAGLEANQKSLDESLSLYERGQALAAHCAGLLDQAELRVQRLGETDLQSLEDGEVD
jgi:exodeoxyribonuclease VII small subunit